MEDKKIIGMPYKCVLALTWLLFPFGIVALAVDHAKMDRNQKQHIVQAFVWCGIATIIAVIVGIANSVVWAIATANDTTADWMSWIYRGVELLLFVVMLIMMIEAFLDKFIQLPGLWGLAGKFLGAEKKPQEEPKAEEAPVEEPVEETPADTETKE